jgi:DNA-binding response OmpR family regulator
VENRLALVMSGAQESTIGFLRVDEKTRKKRAAPKVLIADTDEAIVNLLRFFCAREGFEVDNVGTGNDALDYLMKAREQDELPGVVVLEAFLPGMDGFQVLEKIQTEFQNRVSVIMLSVRPSEERVSKAFEMGAMDFIAKPFRVPEIIARIRNGIIRTCAV